MEEQKEDKESDCHEKNNTCISSCIFTGLCTLDDPAGPYAGMGLKVPGGRDYHRHIQRGDHAGIPVLPDSLYEEKA